MCSTLGVRCNFHPHSYNFDSLYPENFITINIANYSAISYSVDIEHIMYSCHDKLFYRHGHGGHRGEEGIEGRTQKGLGHKRDWGMEDRKQKWHGTYRTSTARKKR